MLVCACDKTLRFSPSSQIQWLAVTSAQGILIQSVLAASTNTRAVHNLLPSPANRPHCRISHCGEVTTHPDVLCVPNLTVCVFTRIWLQLIWPFHISFGINWASPWDHSILLYLCMWLVVPLVPLEEDWCSIIHPHLSVAAICLEENPNQMCFCVSMTANLLIF